jgi:hypothetical protein
VEGPPVRLTDLRQTRPAPTATANGHLRIVRDQTQPGSDQAADEGELDDSQSPRRLSPQQHSAAAKRQDHQAYKG